MTAETIVNNSNEPIEDVVTSLPTELPSALATIVEPATNATELNQLIPTSDLEQLTFSDLLTQTRNRLGPDCTPLDFLNACKQTLQQTVVQNGGYTLHSLSLVKQLTNLNLKISGAHSEHVDDLKKAWRSGASGDPTLLQIPGLEKQIKPQPANASPKTAERIQQMLTFPHLVQYLAQTRHLVPFTINETSREGSDFQVITQLEAILSSPQVAEIFLYFVNGRMDGYIRDLIQSLSADPQTQGKLSRQINTLLSDYRHSADAGLLPDVYKPKTYHDFLELASSLDNIQRRQNSALSKVLNTEAEIRVATIQLQAYLAKGKMTAEKIVSGGKVASEKIYAFSEACGYILAAGVLGLTAGTLEGTGKGIEKVGTGTGRIVEGIGIGTGEIIDHTIVGLGQIGGSLREIPENIVHGYKEGRKRAVKIREPKK